MYDDTINKALAKLPEILRQDMERNLCTCNDVPRIDIITAIVNGATSVEAIREETYATMGTGCCRQQVERLLECLCAPEKAKRNRRSKQRSGESKTKR
ncbi:MAG: (2Fe-2S)-binding protein [Gammaproteobacteria bacterium]|nr:(2Fe-2S)-binding protein [Gammaproteobacteria bacterium]MDH5650392.1 (2Fe-2S)-binding protein [Gammaproteobacteria bacterium]